MTEEMPPCGFPMRWAITALAPEGQKPWVEQHDASWPQPGAALEEARRHLWIGLLFRAYAEEVNFKGARAGAAEVSLIDPALLRGSRPDFDADTLQAAGVLYHAISIFPASSMSHAQPGEAALQKMAPDSRGGGRPKTHDWTAFDAEVVRVGWEDGFTTRQALTAKMGKWCETNWSTLPDNSTIRKHVAKLCPRDVPAE